MCWEGWTGEGSLGGWHGGRTAAASVALALLGGDPGWLVHGLAWASRYLSLGRVFGLLACMYAVIMVAVCVVLDQTRPVEEVVEGMDAALQLPPTSSAPPRP